MATDNLMPQSSTSVIKHLMLRSSTTGQGLTGKVHSDFSGKYNIAGGAEVTLSFSSGSAGDAYSSGKIVPLGLGKYAWHVPDAVFASLGNVSAVLSVSGGIDVHCEWLVVAAVRDTAAFGANITTPPTAAAVADEVQTRTIARVTLVDTCSVNSDMRGTNDAMLAASYVSPPSAATISTQVAADLLAAHGSGSWTTATGFATPTNVSDAQTAILAKLPAALEGGRIAAALDSDALTKIDDILTDTGTTLPAQIAGIEGGGGSSVNVLPAVGIVANRSPGVTLLPVVGETISQSITLYQTDGTTPVDLGGKTLKIIFETLSGADVAVVLNNDITVSGADDNVVTFAYPSAVTASERVLKFALRDAAAPLTMYLQGVCSVVAAPKVDA
jgi:hypothetical protein